MRFRAAELTDFRNIASAVLELSPRLTALVGLNGHGKTNTLEALYFLSALRPLRTVARRSLIREGCERARIQVEVESAKTALEHRLHVEIRDASRILSKDHKRCDAHAFLGCAVAVAFVPDDLQLAKGGPDSRRRFLDRALLNARPAYLQHALRYQKAVRDRNRLLLEQGSDALLDAFDAIIAHEGARIAVARATYVRELEPHVREQFDAIAAPVPALSLTYTSTLEPHLDPGSPEATERAFLGLLRERRGADRRRRSTSVGPHLDDLELSLEGVLARERASQGQHRALVLALKLAEIIHLTRALGEPPLLLLDDMSSELDAVRSSQLIETVCRLDGQVVLTSTQEPAARGPLSRAGELVVYRVEAGRIQRA